MCVKNMLKVNKFVWSMQNKPTPRKRRQPTNQATTAEESTPVSLTADKPVKKKKPKAASKEPSDATASPSAGEANQTKVTALFMHDIYFKSLF